MKDKIELGDGLTLTFELDKVWDGNQQNTRGLTLRHDNKVIANTMKCAEILDPQQWALEILEQLEQIETEKARVVLEELAAYNKRIYDTHYKMVEKAKYYEGLSATVNKLFEEQTLDRA